MESNLRILQSLKKINENIQDTYNKQKDLEKKQQKFQQETSNTNKAFNVEQNVLKTRQDALEEKQFNLNNEQNNLLSRQDKVDDTVKRIEEKVNEIKINMPKDGKDGSDGKDGKDGRDGKDGMPGKDGRDGERGLPGVPGIAGKDGVGIKNTKVNNEGDLIIELTNSKKINAGRVKGANGTGINGANGHDGISVTNAEVKNNHLYITLSDERIIDAGVISGGSGGEEIDPIFTSSAAYNITSTDINNWNNKSDFSGSYNDLVDKPELFSGDYNDLDNKPTIPTVPTNVSAFINDVGYLKTTYYTVILNSNGTINTYSEDISYETIKNNLSDSKTKDVLEIVWVNSKFYIPVTEITNVNDGDIKFVGDIEFDGIQRRMVFTLTPNNVLATTLITTNEIVSNKVSSIVSNSTSIDKYPNTKAVFDEFQRKPVVVWESSTPSEYLKAIQANLSANPTWQLTNLDLTPFKRIKIYSCAGQKSGTTASASTTPAIILEMSLDSRNAISAYDGNYVGSAMVQKPNDANRFATLTCAVSADKTSFVVLRQTNLYGTAATSNNDVNANVFMIEGYYD